jgi:hypothetical protein
MYLVNRLVSHLPSGLASTFGIANAVDLDA